MIPLTAKYSISPTSFCSYYYYNTYICVICNMLYVFFKKIYARRSTSLKQAYAPIAETNIITITNECGSTPHTKRNVQIAQNIINTKPINAIKLKLPLFQFCLLLELSSLCFLIFSVFAHLLYQVR